jgi:predicted nucleic acid-binding protein
VNVLVVDTSSWITYFKEGRGDDLDLALREARVYLAPVVAAELMSGKLNNADRAKLAGLLSDLPLCNCDLDHWIRVGELRAKLRARGLAVSTPDAHVAQCALDLNGYLISEDSIFSKIAKVTPLRLLAQA